MNDIYRINDAGGLKRRSATIMVSQSLNQLLGSTLSCSWLGVTTTTVTIRICTAHIGVGVGVGDGIGG